MFAQLSGHKRTASGSIRDVERRPCGKVILLDTQGMRKALEELRHAAEGRPVGKYTLCHLQLQLAKELVVSATSLLDFLSLVVELDELSTHATLDTIPRLTRLIDDCQLLIVDTNDAAPWQPNPARDAKTLDLLTQSISATSAAISAIFNPRQTVLSRQDRHGIMLACRALFEAADDLLRAAEEEGVGDEGVGAFVAGAVGRCEGQTLGEYFLEVGVEEEGE